MRNFVKLVVIIIPFGVSSVAFAQEDADYKTYKQQQTKQVKEQVEYIIKEDPKQPEKLIFIPIVKSATDPKIKDNKETAETTESAKENTATSKQENTKLMPDGSDRPKTFPTPSPVIPSSTTATKPEVETSVLSYNFLYLLIQKFKLAEIIE